MSIYKYFPPKRIDTLENNKLCFSTAHKFNDPFELKPYVKAICTTEYLEELHTEKSSAALAKAYKELPRAQRKAFSFKKFEKMYDSYEVVNEASKRMAALTPMAANSALSTLANNTGILCLTKQPDNLLMWSHYAESHQGFVIEFDEESCFFNQKRSDNDEFGHLREVIYQQARPSIVLSNTHASELLLTKGLIWAPEEEWRMLWPRSNDPGESYLLDFPSSAVKSVILGCNMTKNNKEKIFGIINSEKYAHAECIEYKLCEKEYKLIASPYNPKFSFR